IHLAEPERGTLHGLHHFVEAGRLREPIAAKVDRAGMMLATEWIEPVAVDEIAVGIEGTKEGVGDCGLPDIRLDLDPVPHWLSAGDYRLLAGRSLVDDSIRVDVPPRGGLTRSREKTSCTAIMSPSRRGLVSC